MEQRRARARLAGGEQGPVDHLGVELEAAVVVEEAEPIGEQPHAGLRRPAVPLGVHLCRPDGLDGEAEPLGQGVVAPVGEAGLGPGGGEQLAGIERRGAHATSPQRRSSSSSAARTFSAERAP